MVNESRDWPHVRAYYRSRGMSEDEIEQKVERYRLFNDRAGRLQLLRQIAPVPFSELVTADDAVRAHAFGVQLD